MKQKVKDILKSQCPGVCLGLPGLYKTCRMVFKWTRRTLPTRQALQSFCKDGRYFRKKMHYGLSLVGIPLGAQDHGTRLFG